MTYEAHNDSVKISEHSDGLSYRSGGSEESDITKAETVKLIRKNINFAIADRYNISEEEFNQIKLELILNAKNCHLNAAYQEVCLNTPIENLKRFYSNSEAKERVPKIANYYKNYLKFFCNPIFRDFRVNELVQNYGDCKAELYYKNNYGGRGRGSDPSNANQAQSLTNGSNERDNQEDKSLFSDSIRVHINHNSITQSQIYQDSVLFQDFAEKRHKDWNEREPSQGMTQLIDNSKYSKKSGLVTERSKDDSIINNILSNLEGNILRSSINDRIIDKLQKTSKKTTNNFSTTDKTKPDEIHNADSKPTNNNFRKNQSSRVSNNYMLNQPEKNINPNLFRTIHSNNAQNSNIVILANSKVAGMGIIKPNSKLSTKLSKQPKDDYIKKLFTGKYQDQFVKSVSPNKIIDEAKHQAYKPNLRYTVTMNPERANMKSPNTFKRNHPKVTKEGSISGGEKTSEGSKFSKVVSRGSDVSINTHLNVAEGQVKSGTTSKGNLLLNSYSGNPGLNINKFLNAANNNSHDRSKGSDNKALDEKSEMVKRVGSHGSRNIATPIKSSNSLSKSQYNSLSKSKTIVLNKKNSNENKNLSVRASVPSEPIQKVTLSLYIENYNQTKLKSSYTNLKKSKNTVLQKSFSPHKTLNSIRKDDFYSSSMSASTHTLLKNKFNASNSVTHSKDLSKKTGANYSTEKQVRSNYNSSSVSAVKVSSKGGKPMSNFKSSRNKSPAIEKLGQSKSINDATRREAFKSKNKLFSSCSNIRAPQEEVKRSETRIGVDRSVNLNSNLNEGRSVSKSPVKNYVKSQITLSPKGGLMASSVGFKNERKSQSIGRQRLDLKRTFPEKKAIKCTGLK